MKTYILTEVDVEKFKDEFCLSKLQSEAFDQMLKQLISVEHSEWAEINLVHAAKPFEPNIRVFCEDKELPVKGYIDEKNLNVKLPPILSIIDRNNER